MADTTVAVQAPTVYTVSADRLPMRTLLYGDTGSGKTSLAATANLHPDMYPALVLNFDDGLSSVAHLDDGEAVRAVNIADNTQMMVVLSQFLKEPKYRQDGYQDVKTIIIDSISAWRDRTMTQLVEKAISADQRKERKTQIQDFGEMTFTLQSILQGLAQTNLHMILTAGLDEERDQTGMTVLKAQPLINPRLRQSVSHMMSFIWYTQEKNGSYRLLTLPRGVYRIKTRNPRYVEAIKAETRRRTAEKWAGDEKVQEKVEASEGWWVLGLDDNFQPTPNLADLYELYLTATTSK